MREELEDRCDRLNRVKWTVELFEQAVELEHAAYKRARAEGSAVPPLEFILAPLDLGIGKDVAESYRITYSWAFSFDPGDDLAAHEEAYRDIITSPFTPLSFVLERDDDV